MRLPHFPTLDRYLLAQLLPPFVVSLAAVLAALLLERLLVLFDDLAAEGSSLATFVSLLTDLLPHYLGLALPAALCVSVFLIIRRMSDNNEIDALMASGVSLLRIARPYMWTGVLVGCGSILLYGYIQPVARYDFRSGFYYAAHSGWAPHLQAGMFATTSGDSMLTADRVTRNGTVLHEVFIRQREPDGAVRIITARRGLVTAVPSLKQTRLDLWDGLIVYDPRNGNANATQTRFDHSMKVFDQSHDTAAFRSRGIDERELTLLELATRLESSHQSDGAEGTGGITRSSLRAELDFRLARALAIPFIPPLAVALAIGAKRRRPIIGLIALAIVLVGFDHTLQFGHGLIATGRMRGFYAIWLPEILFCTVCLASIFRRSRGSWRRRKAIPLTTGGAA
ncbi:LptF/LptG family permease [Asaia krungthepensis]|uniref:Transporter YjgP/YjgQ n=1 Tax=Asaia krungthepensis NRIC 0535 TaxID=1307925 RepID=A0ABQ0PY17_9PROT|nr:LptF/LptG family permease [Asaia krungthepensis]GBQ84461.1 transporter YjgP/YjgQ [Asaia krungthepensis NRIC 0535]